MLRRTFHKEATYSMQPTPQQTQFLAKWNITPGPTYAVCEKMIRFIQHGNGAAGTADIVDRVKMLKSAQKTWCGERILHLIDQRKGTVISVRPKTRNEVVNSGKRGGKTTPFFVHVRFDDGSWSAIVSPTNIRLLQE